MRQLTKFMCIILAVVLRTGLVAPTMAADMARKPGGFPERPITMIVPYGVGGGSDQLSRAMASALGEVVGTGVEVINRPGGGGRAAIPDFMTAPADGYTVMEHIDDAATLYASGKIKENPAKDWIPLAIAQITFNQIYIRPGDSRFTDWTSFLKYVKANPGKVTVANVATAGSMERVNVLLLEKELGFETQQISIESPRERYAALVGGRVDALFEQPGDVRSFLEAGKMKPILTLLNERPSGFGEVPSMKDIGVTFEPLLRFRGFYVQKGVPTDRIQYLEWAFQEGYRTTDFQNFNKKQYMHLIDSYRGTEGAKTLIDKAVKTYQKVYREIGMTK